MLQMHTVVDWRYHLSQCLVDRGQLFGGEISPFHGRDALFKMLGPAGTDQGRRDVLALAQGPGESQLGETLVARFRDFLKVSPRLRMAGSIRPGSSDLPWVARLRWGMSRRYFSVRNPYARGEKTMPPTPSSAAALSMPPVSAARSSMF